MAVSRSTSELPGSVNRRGGSESIRLPSEIGLDKKIKEDDFVSVLKFLTPRSVKWYNIGLYLKITPGELDIIKVDNPDTPTKLAKMIYTWIINSINCTWGVLVKAVMESDRITQCSESGCEPMETQILPSGDFWERKQQELSDYRYDDYMIQLRAKLTVSKDISNELMLENIEQFIPNTSFPYIKDFHTFASTIKRVITRFKQNQERIEEKAEDLIKVCDKIQTLEAQEKASNEAEVKYITEDLEGAFYNNECLHHRLNTSLDDINKTLNQTDRLNFATNSIKKYFKGIAPLPIFIFTSLGLLTLLLLTSTLTSIIATIFITVLVLVALRLAYDIYPRAKSMVNELPHKLHKSMLLAKHKIFVSYAICGAIATTLLAFFISIIQAKQIPPKSHVSKFAISGLAKTELTLDNVPYYSHLVLSLVVGIILGGLARLVVRGANIRNQVIAFVCYNLIFFILVWTSSVTNIILALIGAAIGLYAQGSVHRGMRTITTISVFLVGSALIPVIWGTGIFIGVYLGEHISQHEIIHIITTATGGALGGVCSLALIRFTIFPFYYIDHHMAESIQHLNENTENLKLLKQTIQGLLDRVQSSDFPLRSSSYKDSISVTLEN